MAKHCPRKKVPWTLSLMERKYVRMIFHFVTAMTNINELTEAWLRSLKKNYDFILLENIRNPLNGIEKKVLFSRVELSGNICYVGNWNY